ncbi:type VII secretion protein EccE [Streptacidiphilus carbonis]|uniref:type VII secretion protein EccE n=1 Tax=Streptacidiphilus carbonis TaxID=105422 RepID=UPI0005A6A923|nr:type VII secretion protein EccE [Streptacidiphilus carbonis]
MSSQTAPPRVQQPQGPSDRPGANAPAARRAAQVQPLPRPRPGRLGPLRLPQLVLFEIAAVLVVVGLGAGMKVLVPCGSVAAVLVLLGLVRRHGLTPAEMIRARSGLRNRQRRARTAAAPAVEVDPAMAPVLECEPALRTVQHTVQVEGSATTGRRERREIGMIGDGTFLTAVIQVEALDDPLRPVRGGHSGLPLDLLADGLQVDDVTVDSVQVVQYSQPAPAPHLPEQALAARGYRELPDGAGTPGLRMTWVAVRLDPELCRTAVAARGGGEAGARKALQRATDQLASRLVGAGLRATVLDAGGVTAAVSTATCASPLRTNASATGDRRTSETARAWRCDDRWHATYWIGQWPRLTAPGTGTDAAGLVNLLTGMPALGTSFGLTLRQAGGGSVALSGHVRVTARGEGDLDQVTRQLENRARSAGVGLVRLDHEQVPGLLATLPLGGTR